MSKQKVPGYVLMALEITTQREFKQQKRRELKAVLEAWEIFRSGCVYCHRYETGNISRADSQLEQIKQDLSVKEWGR